MSTTSGLSTGPTDLPRVGVWYAPYGAASLVDVRRAAAGLCCPVVLVTPQLAERQPELVALGNRIFETVVIPPEALVETVRQFRLAGLTTFHDAYLDLVDEAVAATGLPGHLRSVSPWDKLEQRSVLAARGLTKVRAWPVDTEQQFVQAAAACAGPWVLKPRRGVGGVGVAFGNTPADVDHQRVHRRQWRGLLLETRLPDFRHPSGAAGLADFVSVETANADTGRHHLAVFDKTPVSVTLRAGADAADAVAVTGDITPSRLDAPVRDAVLRYVADCLEALDIRWRVTHTEVKLTPEGPDLIEINGRVGGHLNRLLRLVKGPDLVAVALSLAVGREPAVTGASAHGYAMGMFPPFPDRRGRVRSRVTAAELRALPGVVGVDDLAVAGQPKEKTDYRMANVTLWAPDGAELDRVSALTAAAIGRLYADDSPASHCR